MILGPKGLKNHKGIGMSRLFVFIALLGLLGACAPRQIAGLSKPVAEAKVERIFVATQRTLSETRSLFGAKRPRKMNYRVVDVSVPTTHKLGQIEWGRGEADPKRHFAAVDLEVFEDVKQFRSAIRSEPSGPLNVTNVYVHGFNTTVDEAVFRLAQIRHDFIDPSPAVVFAWPSAARLGAYAYDRDSVLFARDDLVKLLRDLTKETEANVRITAHSMGAQLAMEALRHIAISGDRRLLSRVSGVVLVAPDIDPDVFRRQAEAIGDLPEEFYIFAAQQDRALRLSALLTGKERVGVIQGTKDVEGLDVTVIDFSQLTDGKHLDHQVGLTSPGAIRVLNGLLDNNPNGLLETSSKRLEGTKHTEFFSLGPT